MNQFWSGTRTNAWLELAENGFVSCASHHLRFCETVLTKLWVVSGTFSNTSTCSSSPVSQEMSVSQPIGFFSLKQEVESVVEEEVESSVNTSHCCWFNHHTESTADLTKTVSS